MAVSNIDVSTNLGKLLQIAFSEGVRNQISEDFRDWEQIKMNRVGEADGRELRFIFERSYGPAAIQYRGTGTASFPASQQATTSEHTAIYKEIDATIELEYNLWNRARKSPSKYAEPLALEVQAKTIASKRRLAIDLFGDGTGVVGTASSIADSSGNAETVVTLNTADTARGFIGWFEFGDLLLAKTTAGAAQTAPTVTGTFYAWRVKSKARRTDAVTLEAVDSSGAVLPLTASNIAATNVFYRVGQPTFPDLTAITGTTDYGTLTEVIAGLESLVSNDARTMHGIRMTGATGASVLDANAEAIDTSHVHEAMSNAKIAVGQSKYKWKKLCMAPEVHKAFIESRETDRRFQTVEDNKRGTKYFAYVHGEDTLECYESEFVPKKRIYALPEQKSGQKVIEFYGTDFEPVKAGDMSEFHLKPASGGGHQRSMVSYMEALGVLINKHPASCVQIRNFTF